MTWARGRGVDRQHAHFITFILLQCALNGILIPRSLLQYSCLTGERMLQFAANPAHPPEPLRCISSGVIRRYSYLNQRNPLCFPSLSWMHYPCWVLQNHWLHFSPRCQLKGSLNKSARSDSISVQRHPLQYIRSVTEGERTTSSKTMVKWWITYPSNFQQGYKY